MRRGSQLIAAFAIIIMGLVGCGGALDRPEGGVTPDGGAKPEGGVDLAACTVVPVQPLAGTPCRYELPVPPACDGVIGNTHIGVKVAGITIPRDPNHTDGWDYTDETFLIVEVFGPSCDAVTASPTLPVSIVYLIHPI